MKHFNVIVVLSLAFAMLACSFGSTLFTPTISSTSTASPTSFVQQPTPRTAITSEGYIPQTVVPPAISGTDVDSRLPEIYRQVIPGVVSILTVGDQGGGLGSGFVYDKNGHIITNFHVVDGASDLEVDFASGLKVRADVVATDLDSDLAVIKVNTSASELVPLSLGDSDQVLVGQQVVALGNPFGLTGTMTLGIVSAKGRTLDSLRQASSGSYFSSGDIIQTDASINPGNSGGPLLNMNGEVIGINRSIRTTGTTASGNPVNSGIGFAIPINIVKRVVPVLISHGSHDYPYLGITFSSFLSLADYEALGYNQTTGAYILEVATGGPGDQAGLRGPSQLSNSLTIPKGGDLVIGVDGRPVLEFGDLIGYILENKSPGDDVTITILRDNEQKEVMLTLGKRP
jgi:S1-C subfamily serine protease